MIPQDTVEEVLVAILERGEPDVSLQGIGLAGDVLVDAAGLLLDGVGRPRQEALQTERAPLLAREGAALVEHGLGEELRAPVRNLDAQPPAGMLSHAIRLHRLLVASGRPATLALAWQALRSLPSRDALVTSPRCAAQRESKIVVRPAASNART